MRLLDVNVTEYHQCINNLAYTFQHAGSSIVDSSLEGGDDGICEAPEGDAVSVSQGLLKEYGEWYE